MLKIGELESRKGLLIVAIDTKAKDIGIEMIEMVHTNTGVSIRKDGTILESGIQGRRACQEINYYHCRFHTFTQVGQTSVGQI